MATLAALAGYAVSAEGAAAKDLRALAEFVVPAYTAMNFTMVCAQDDPQFLSRTRGVRGNALEYAEHVKDEAIASLTYDEAVAVLTMAADEARTIARRELRKLAPNYPAARPGEITNWCRNDASNFVRAFIEQHDGRHAMLLQDLERARQ
ncbi:MAG TPA: hypothetical protein VFB31_03375 [Pseudolabrys sp.]|nr:hypothetical protein [Pseudolabrys sp.]